MKNIADSVVRCGSCGSSFTLRELGKHDLAFSGCPNCEANWEDRVFYKAIHVPEKFTRAMHDTFLHANNEMITGTPLQDALKSFHAAVRQAEKYLEKKATSILC